MSWRERWGLLEYFQVRKWTGSERLSELAIVFRNLPMIRYVGEEDEPEG